MKEEVRAFAVFGEHSISEKSQVVPPGKPMLAKGSGSRPNTVSTKIWQSADSMD